MKNQPLRVALVYDRVNTPYGGAEKLLLTLHQLFPNAPLYTSVYEPSQAPWAKVFRVIPSFLNHWSWLRTRHQLLAFLMPLAFESFDFSDFEVVISISSAEAKGVLTRPETLHLCYLLTPPRYLYSHRDFYLKHSLVFNLPVIGWIARRLLDYLTAWDQLAIHRPDLIIPISELVKRRVKQYYSLDCAEPIYPSLVDVPTAPPPTTSVPDSSENYLLIVSRLVPYKNIDLAIRACQELDQPLIIVGQGESEAALRALITKPDLIKIRKKVTSTQLDQLYQNCTGVLMPGEEDFGIVALEALAHFQPVLINANSGASELIVDYKSGLHLKKIDLQEFKTKILEMKQYDFDPAIMSRCLSQHNTETFKKQFISAVKTALENSL